MPAKMRDLARTRECILKAALTEFAANGLAGARCGEIAHRAGVNKRMLFRGYSTGAFRSDPVKEDKLLSKAIEKMFEKFPPKQNEEGRMN